MCPEQQPEAVVELTDSAAANPEVVGRKFAWLADLYSRGYPVPPAVCLPVSVHQGWIEQGGLPEEIKEAILARAEGLGLAEGLAVRSSGVLEDLPEASFAGQYASFLNVRSAKSLCQAIEDCLAAADRPGLKTYLNLSGRADQQPHLAVILQRMVRASYAGVAFSRHPQPGRQQDSLIEAVPGRGDRLVSGELTPVRASVSPTGSIYWDQPAADDPGPDESLLRRLDSWLRALDRGLEAPVDVEWAADGDAQLWILQLRPAMSVSSSFQIPEGIWTRAIAEDLWADRLTPFMAEVMLDNRSRFDFSGPLTAMGITLEQPRLTVIDGFLYLNCRSFVPLIQTFPWLMRFGSIAELFPPDIDPLTEPEAGFRRLPLMLRGLAFIVASPRANPLLSAWVTSRWLKGLHGRLDELERQPLEGAEAVEGVLDTALAELADLQEQNQWPYGYATALVWLLRRLTGDGSSEQGKAFVHILRSSGRSITSRIGKEFERLSRQIRSDPELVELFSRHGPEELLPLLPERFRSELEGFLEAYGCRCGSRSLLIPRWIEEPSQVLGMLQGLALQPFSRSDTDRPEKDRKSVPISLRPLAAAARRFLDLREELRFALDRILLLIRRCLLTIGKDTGLDQEVFFLSRRELKGLFSESDEAAASLKPLAATRSRRAEREPQPPKFYVHGQPVRPERQGSESIQGLGASPGRVRGTAVLVEHLSEATIPAGSILIARRADPGWTPLFPRLAGLAVEEGGLLNHCAIVAREVGLPLVVGAAGITRRISSGQQVVLDGTTGLIELPEASRTD